MIKVEVLIDNFKDEENYSKEIPIVRNGSELKLKRKLLQKGDIYEISKERYEHLSKKGIVAKYKNSKKEVTEEIEDNK